MKRALTTIAETLVLIGIFGVALVFYSLAPELNAAMIAAMGK
jgi:hypothetical protein